MDALGTVCLRDYKLFAYRAEMYPVVSKFPPDRSRHGIGNPDLESLERLPPRAGWGFVIKTDAPVEEPPGSAGGFPNGVGLYAWDEPIPLPTIGDFTGLDFALPVGLSPLSGEPYFAFDADEAHEVRAVRIRFFERQGAGYRVEVSAVVHNLFDTPVEVRYAGLIQVTQGPAPEAEPG